MCINIDCIYVYPPDPMNHAKIFKGQHSRAVLWELILNWYKIFSSDHMHLVEIKKLTGLSVKTSSA